MENDNQLRVQNPPQQFNPTNSSVAGESHNSAMHFFLYLISFFSLAAFASGAGAILFQWVNNAFPDKVLDYSSYFSQYAIKYGIASLIIGAPIYFVIMYFLVKFLSQVKISENSKVRKWLTYIILFFTSATIIGDLVTLVYNMLSGDMMIQFLLKVLIVLFIAGTILSYYLIDMRRKEMTEKKYLSNKIYGISAMVLTLIILVIGFTLIDNPFVSRDRKIDDQTINNIWSLESQIQNYYQENYALPASINDLNSESRVSLDRERYKDISYQKTSDKEYKLCADFKRASSEYKKEQQPYYSEYLNESKEWEHGKGNYCFSKNVSKVVSENLYKPSVLAMDPAVDSLALVEARKRAQTASIKSYISSAIPGAIFCRDAEKTLISGKGGDLMCSAKDENGVSDESLIWPTIYYCGPNPEDTQWIVKNGNADNWDYILSCKNLRQCDGPANALCNSDGCLFNGEC
jgi:hypothetical protein